MSEQVSAEDTDGLEQPVVEEYEETEIGLLTIVAALIAADLAAGVLSPAARLGALRRAVTSFLRRRRTSGRAKARQALESAAQVGRSAAERAVSALDRGRNRAGGAGSSSPAGDPTAPNGVSSPPNRDVSVSGRLIGDENTPETGPQTPSPGVFAPPAGNRPPSPESGRETGRERGPLTLDDLRATAPRAPRTARGVTTRTPAALLDQLDAMTPHMIAAAEGIYRDVMTQVLASPLDSDAARLRLAQRLLDQYAAKGITGFRDRGGRRWSMVSYVEMATRTAAMQTAIDAHCALVAAHGYDLVRVSVHQNCSPMCAPFQGHLLSITGATTDVGPESWRSRVKASLLEARTRGFNHPSCKHQVAIWVPGDPLPAAPEVDPADYEAEQGLRALERRLRAARRRKAAALDDQARRKANARIRAYRQQISAHVAAHPTVLRKPHRERIDGPL